MTEEELITDIQDVEIKDEREFEEVFSSHLRKSLENYEREEDMKIEKPSLPDGAVLTKNGLIQMQVDTAKVRGGDYDVDVVLNATGCIYGRFASIVAEMAQEG